MKLIRCGNVAVTAASFCIATTIDAGGRTVRSLLNLLLNLAREENSIYKISKNSKQGLMLCQSKLLVIDEYTILHIQAVGALDRTLR